MPRFLLHFLVFVIAGVVILTRPEVKHLFSEPWGSLLAQIVYAALSPFDASLTRSGNILADAGNSFAVAVDAECNGIDIVMLFWAAVLAFPLGWRQKLMGLALGFIGLQLLNLIRIASLFYLGRWNQDIFTWSHHNLWQGVMMFGAILLFYLWLRFGAPQGPRGGRHGESAA